VEGPILAGHHNQRHHAFQIIEDIASGNPHRLKTGSMEQAIANSITLRTVTHRMRFAIDLDCQPALKAGKVDHISKEGKLSAKPKTVRPLP
jgi:hypothetical protein